MSGLESSALEVSGLSGLLSRRTTIAATAVRTRMEIRPASLRPSPSTSAATMPSSLLLRLKRVCSTATARMLPPVPRRNTPIMSRSIAQTMSKVTSAPARDSIE